MTIQTLMRIETHNNKVIDFLQVDKEYCVDSRIVATGLGLEHESLMKTIFTYQPRLERWGILRFQIGEIKGRGQPEKYVLLNHNQILFTITLSRNTPEVLDWKEAIIDALDQLEKQMSISHKRHGRPRKIKYQRIHKRIPPNLEDEILRHMTRLASKGQDWITANGLRGYMKGKSREEIEDQLKVLSLAGKLENVKTSQSTKYTLQGGSDGQ